MGNSEQKQKKTHISAPPPGFEIDKFLGTWYEMSHTKNAPKSCQNAIIDITRKATHINLLWSCYKNYVNTDVYKGRIEMPDENEKSKLIIIYRGVRDTFIDFWVYQTDYISYAIAGNPDGHIWILSREPYIGENLYDVIVKKALDLGLSVNELIVNDNVIHESK